MNRDDKYTGFLAVPGMIVLAIGIILTGWAFFGSIITKSSVIFPIFYGPFFVGNIWALWVCWHTRIEIDAKGVRYISPKKKGDIRWEDMKCAGEFRIPVSLDTLMFFSTIDEVWRKTDMMANRLPLDKLIKVMPNKKIRAIVAKYYPGEFVQLSQR